MKKFLAIIGAILVLTMVAVPSFATEKAEESCHHVIEHNYDAELPTYTCSHCGEKVWECQTCGNVTNLSVRVCPVCGHARKAITSEEKQQDYKEIVNSNKETAKFGIITSSVMLLILLIYFAVDIITNNAKIIRTNSLFPLPFVVLIGLLILSIVAYNNPQNFI